MSGSGPPVTCCQQASRARIPSWWVSRQAGRGQCPVAGWVLRRRAPRTGLPIPAPGRDFPVSRPAPELRVGSAIAGRSPSFLADGQGRAYQSCGLLEPPPTPDRDHAELVVAASLSRAGRRASSLMAREPGVPFLSLIQPPPICAEYAELVVAGRYPRPVTESSLMARERAYQSTASSSRPRPAPRCRAGGSWSLSRAGRRVPP